MPEQYKVDPATGRIAIRTQFEDYGPFIPHAWCVADRGSAPGFRSTAEVESWIDVSDAVAAALAAVPPPSDPS